MLGNLQVTKLEFVSNEVFRGLCGLVWFVNEKSLRPQRMMGLGAFKGDMGDVYIYIYVYI